MSSEQRTALRVAAAYLLFGIVWIVLSDVWLETLVGDPVRQAMMQTLKGATFVLVTSLVLFLLLWKELRRRSRVEERLRVNAGHLEVIIEASPLAIIAMDADNSVTLWSPAAERIFGWTPAEVVGGPVPFIGSGHVDEVDTLRARVAAGESLSGIEIRRSRRDGRPVDLRLSAAPLRGVDGEIVGAMVVVSDLTEWKKLEAQLRQAQKMEAVGRLAGGIGHDFNNILTGIAGYTEMVLEALPPDSAIADDALEIRRATVSATALTRQLLTFSRKRPVSSKKVDLNECIRSLDSMLRVLAGKEVVLHAQLEEGLWPIEADQGQLEQVIMNLAVNARDAMPAGGRLTLETRNVELDEEYARTHLGVEPGPCVLLLVSDSGEGMDEEVRSRLFEPFFTTKEDGTGLGLAMVYGILRQHGGVIDVYSEPGRGSTFRIYLPRRVEPGTRWGDDDAAKGEEEREVALHTGETVLVAEDSGEVRRIVGRVLGEAGYELILAGSGEEALEALHTLPHGVDLLITDMVLPGMSGPELAARLLARHPRAKVLFTSRYSRSALADQLEERAFFIEKPFNPEQLVREVRGVLNGRGRHRESEEAGGER